MKVAQVVEATNDKHAGGQRLGLLGQRACAPGQPGKAETERGVEPLDVSGVDEARHTLRGLPEALNLLWAPLYDASLNVQRRGRPLLHHLDDGNIGPGG